MVAQHVKRVTRADVAKLAGVSTAVVSYVVNNGPRPVAPVSRKRVLNAIAELGYTPNAPARALRLGATSTYGVAVPNVSHSFHSEVVKEIDHELSKQDISMLLANTNDLEQNELTLIRNIVGRGVDGLIVLMSSLEDHIWRQEKGSVPTVLLDRQTGLEGFLTIGPDFLAGGRMATQHLIDHGHTRILPIFGSFTRGDINARHIGYLQAIESAGLKPMEPLICDWTRQGGYQAGKEFVATGNNATAVFCLSDAIGIGFEQALLEAGFDLPSQVAIIGFDGISGVNFVHPTLSTVKQPVAEMVGFAVQSLIAGGTFGEGIHKVFPVSMQLGHSCGCP